MVRGIAVALALLFVAPAANAQFRLEIGGKKISPQKANSTLKRLDKQLQGGFKLVNRPYGKDPARELRDIEKAEKVAAEVADKLTVDLRLAGGNYDTVKKNIAKLKEAAAMGRLQQACSAARAEISAINNKGEVASDAHLGKFDQAVAALAKGLQGDKVVEFWTEEARKAREGQGAVAEKAQAKAARAAEKAQQKEAEGAKRGLRALDKEIRGLMKANEGPIPADKLAAYQAAIDAVVAIDAEGGAWWNSQKRRFGIYNAFHSGSADAVAKAVGGQKITDGRSKGKALKIGFAGQKGWCYSLWSRWATLTGGEKVNNLEIDGSAGKTAQQEYSIWASNTPWNGTRGVCLTAKSKMKITADLKFAGTKNGVEYTVVGWPKAEFPVEEAVDMNVHSGDRCDIEHWQSLWLDPVPGSLVWSGKEAYLLSDPDRAGQLWVTMSNLTGRNSVRARKPELSDDPPSAIAFKTQLSVPKCPGSQYATSKLSQRLAKCSESQREKYGKLYDSARKQKERATTPGAWRSAKIKLDRLPEKERKEYAKKCAPTRAKIEKAWEKGFNGIVDGFVDNPPSATLRRAERLNAEENSY